MLNLKGTISKGGPTISAAEEVKKTQAELMDSHGIESPEPGVFRCKECGATSNVVTGDVIEPGKWIVKGCKCGDVEATP